MVMMIRSTKWRRQYIVMYVVVYSVVVCCVLVYRTWSIVSFYCTLLYCWVALKGMELNESTVDYVFWIELN